MNPTQINPIPAEAARPPLPFPRSRSHRNDTRPAANSSSDCHVQKHGARETSGKGRTKAPRANLDAQNRTNILLDEIACMAFERWNQAGRPPGRLAEFWNKAVQQCRVNS